MQDDIARSVSRSLKVTLLGKHEAGAARGGNAEAYNLYLQGKYFQSRRTREDLEKASGYYERALKLDPGHAGAWTGLANTHAFLASSGWVPLEDGYR